MTSEGRPIYDPFMHRLFELKQLMDDEVAETHKAQREWRRIKDNIAKEFADPVQQRIEARQRPTLSDAFKGVEFHRDMAAMYASVIAAEIGIQQELREARSHPTIRLERE